MKKRVLSLFLALTLCLTLTPTGALAEESLPGQTVVATQETETPTPAPQKEESTAPAENGADENASPASPDEKPTENTPAAPEKNPADEEPGKEAGQNEPTAEGKNEPLALGLDDPGQNAAEGENGEGSGGTHYVAESGGTQYETVQEILDETEEGEITLLDSVTEDLTVCAATTIHMNGHSITGNIDAMDSLTLNGGTVDGTVKVDGGTLNMTAPAEAEAAITGGLKVVSGSAFVSGAQVGVKGTLYFDGTDMLISGAVKAVELNSAAEPAAKTLYGSATVNGDTAAEAGFDTDTYKVGGKIAKKLTNKQVGSTTPAAPSLTLTETSKSLTAGKTAVFTANYTGTDTLNAYVQGSAVNGYFTISQKNNGDGTYTVSVKIDEETPGGTYTLFVHEPGNTSVQASATITVTGLPDAAEVNGKQYKSLPRALNAAQDGDTVKLLANHVTDAEALNALGEDFTFKQYASIVPVVTKTLTLDLNHKTVDYLEVGFTETNEETQKKETLATGSLTVTGEGAYGRILSLMFMGGTLDILGGEIGGSEGAGLVCDADSGPVTVSNGTVYGLTVLEGAAVTVKNGFNHRGRWSVDSGGTLSITGGTFKDVQFVNSGTIAISGGTFEKISNNDTNTPQPLMLLLAKDCAFVNENNTSDVQDGTKTSLTEVMVKEHTHTFENGKCDCGVAAIVVDNNNSFYNTLQAALGAAADDASITSVTLGQDLTEDVMFSGSAAGSLTLNMNGHKLETEAGVPLTVTGGALRIEGAGEINQNTASNANAFPAIALTGGKLVIAGDLTAQGGYDSSSGRKPAIYATDGELDLQGNVSLNGGLTITGTAKLTNPLTQGTFYVDASETGNAIAITDSEVPGGEVYNKVLELLAKDYAFYRADGSLADAGGPKLRIGTYTIKSHTCSYTHNETNGIAFCNCGRRHAHRDLSEEKSVLVNGICPICGYHCPHNNIGDDGVCTDCHAKMVAKVTVGETTTYTADLADALNKAANGTTITLLADTEISAYVNIYDETATNADQMVVTLDLAGHTVTSGNPIVIGADRNGAASHYGTLKIVGTGNITLDYVNLDTREKGVLDLTGWTGESISSVTVTRIGNTNEGKLIVGKDAGHIGRLAFAFVNCPSAEITKTKLYGGSYDEIITIGSGTPSLAGLLPNGCVFKKEDGSFADATASNLFNVTVSACDHGGAEGFDESATACPYCNAPAVAETTLYNDDGSRLQRRFADLQTALDADRDGGAELTLLADVTGDYTIDGTQDTGLNLNGHSIKGTVTVKGTKGDYITTTLSNAQNTTTASIDKVVACDGAELAGSKYPAVIGTLTLAEGATWNNILNGTALGYKVLNTDDTHKWYAPNDVKVSQLNNVIINSLPITSKTLNLKVNGKNLTGRLPKVERGTTVQLCASCNAKDVTVTFSVLKKGETTPITLTEPSYAGGKYTKDYSFDTIGEYTIYFTATKDGYTVQSSEKMLTVTKPDLRNAEITFRSSNESTYEPYNATTTAPSFTVTYNGKTLKLGVDYTASGTASSAGVSTQTLTIKAVEGSDYTGSKTAEWRIVPHKAKVEVGDVIKAYDGTTDLPDGKISLVSAAGSAGHQAGRPLPLSEGSGFELTDAKYDSANASETEKNISFTVKLTDTNYTFDDGTTEKAFTLNGAELNDKTFKINPATIDPSHNRFEQTVFNDLAKTYEIDLKQFLDTILPEGGKYGDIKYGQPSVSMGSAYYTVGGANIENGKLSLSINKATSSKQGEEIGTVAVKVETTNYQPFTLTIHVIAQDKLVPVLAEGNTFSATDITYGQALADSKLAVNGTMKDPNTSATVDGTFAWTDGTITPNAGDYKAEWTFTPAAGYEKYATVTGTVTIKVKPAKLIVSVKASSMYYTGEEQIASIIASGQSVDSTPVTFTYSDKEDGNYTSGVPTFTDAGTYTVYYKAEAANHEPATGTFTVTIAPLPIRLLSVSSISKTYDGSADVTLTADKLTFFSKTANIKLPDTALSFSNAQFTKQQADGSYLPSPEVGNGKALSFTMTLTSKNYVFEGESEGTTEVSDVFATDDANRFTITKAAAPTMQPIELTVINGLAKTYLVNLPALPTLGDNCKYGSIEYEACNFDLIGEGGYANSTATITSNDEFQLTVPAVESQTEGSVGTVGVKITTDNYQDMLLTVEVIAKNKIVPVLDGEITATPITFGQILRVSTIAGTMKDDGKTVEGTFDWTDPSTKPDKAGDYQAEWTFTPAEGYEEYATVTGTVTIKVNKADIPTKAITAPTAQENLTYTGQEQALIIAGSVTDYGTMQYMTEDGTYSQDIPTGTDAGTYNVWYRVIGDANHNDTAPASVPVSIGKKPLPPPRGTAASKTYDGTTNAGITSVTFDNVTLNRGTDYTVTASFDDAGVGNDKNVTATVTLMGQVAKNYALEQSSFTTTGSITKAAAPGSGLRPAVTVINDLAKTYEMVLSNDYLPKLSSPCEYGNVSYSLRGTYLTDGYKDTVQVKVMEENGQYKLKLTVPAVDYNKVSSVGTIDVRVTSDNYRDFYLTIGVKTKNKDVPVPDGTISASDITYGQALNDSKIAGKMKAGGKAIDGTFTWTNGTFKPAAGDYPASWTFTPAKGYEEYATATGTATVTVDPKAVTVSITPNGGSYGETITPATATANDVVGEDNPEITLTYTGTASDGTKYTGTTPPTKAGTYTIKASTTNANYTLVANTATATFTVAKRGVTVTPDNKSKVYEEKDPDLTYAVSGVLDGETLKGITLARAEGENAGEYDITGTADAGANPNYDVTFVKGTFTIKPKSIQSATVVLGKGLAANGAEQTQTVEKVLLNDKELPADSYTVTGNTATDPGSHTLTITAKGNYTGTVEQTYVIVPAKAEDAPDGEIAIGSGEVKVVVKSEGTVPPATLLTNKAELLAMLVDSGDITADELAQIADGANVDIALTVKEANVSAEIKTAMAQAAKGCTIGQYLDISLFKYMTVNGNQQAGVALHTTKDALTISVVVPDALIHTDSAVNRTYCIVRRHDGAITVLDAAFDAASKTLTFKTDRFSDYAIAYKDTAVPGIGSNPGSNNSSNDSETKKNEVAAPTPAPTPASTSKPSTITAMPQTGDTSNPTLYVVLLVASLLGLAVVFVCKKRNDK